MIAIVTLMYVTGGLLFLLSVGAQVYVRVRMRPAPDSDLDEYYHEFEDQHAEYARYTTWLRLTTGGAALGMLLLFLGFML